MVVMHGGGCANEIETLNLMVVMHGGGCAIVIETVNASTTHGERILKISML